MRIREIIDAIERRAALRWQEGFDNSGLQVGDPEAEAKGILITLDITEDIVDEAIAKGCNLIVSHHP
ncbi:MAG: Nif3-like dinuclear metal center hexameric protein, partial [Candidatus Cryptobacteroides sp.]|nr:Nif3-like dinuclear metal center hexameric protein [Bacteroidales bacterium]MDY6158675.1 Nif3-like dinuclear metal center hexameric protein [Candidatus Cryptobacteroides sp.]